MTIKHLFPESWPKVDFNFAAERELDSRITFTRASTGTYVGKNLKIQTAAENEPRFDHDPATGESLGLLIEEARTNSNYPSNDLLDSRYAVSPDYSTSNVAAPDGSSDAVYFAETVGQDSLYVNPTPPSTTFTSATGSVYVKLVGSRQYFAIRQTVAFNDFVRATFDLANESYKFVVGDVDTRSSYSADIENVGNGWYRCSLTVAYSSATTIGMYFNPSDSDTGGGVTSSGFGGPDATALADSGIILWGYQLEAGSFPTSLIPTSGAAADRSPDSVLITGDNLTSWFDGNAGSVFSVASSLQMVNYNTNNLVWHFRDPGRKEHNSGRGFQFFDTFTGGSYNQTSNKWYLNGVPRKAIYAFGEGEAVAAIDGTLLGKITNWLPTAHTSLSLGSNVGFNLFLNGHIYRFAVYPRRLSDEQLQALTS